MERHRTCQVCGKEFTPTHWNQKCCSTECSRSRRLKRYRHYYQEHREELNARFRRYYREHRDEIKERQRRYRKEHRDEIKELMDSRVDGCEHAPSCFECPLPDCVK